MPLHSGRFDVWLEIALSAALAAFSIGPGFAAGREVSFFYTQTGPAAQLGILICALIFGFFMGLTAHYAQKTGACGFIQIFRRSMGVRAGAGVAVLYYGVLALMACIALHTAGQAAALAIPFRFAHAVGVLSALAACAVLTCFRRSFAAGKWYALLLIAFLLGIFAFGKSPGNADIYLHTRLYLKGSVKGAAALACLHGCRCAAAGAGAAAALPSRKIRPGMLGFCCAAWMTLLLWLANACLQKHPIQLLALRQPFVDICAQWGKTGRFTAAFMLWMGAVTGLCGVLLPLRVAVEKGC